MKSKRSEFFNFYNFMIAVYVVIGIVAVVMIFTQMENKIKETNELSTQMTEEKRKLASLSLKQVNKEYAHGSFIYGYGHYSAGQEQKIYYVFFEEQPEGGYKLVKLDSDDVLLCPELKDNEQPYEIITWNGFGTIERRQMYLPRNAIASVYDVDISTLDE